MTNTRFIQQQRREGFERQHGACCYCQGQMSPHTAHPVQPWMATLEHLIQKKRGGRDLDNNTVTACHGCNNSRPCGMPASHYAALRLLLLPAWAACTAPNASVRKTLAALARPMPKGVTKG